MSIDYDTLHTFCAVNDPRAWLNHPLRIEDCVVATNGHIAVATPWNDAQHAGRQYSTAPDEARLAEKVCAARAAASTPGGTWKSVTDIQICIDPCLLCEGSGNVTKKTCPDCDGEGCFAHGHHDYDCKQCEGDGFTVTPRGDKPCKECFATGLTQALSDFDALDEWGPKAANTIYVAALRKLPLAQLRAELEAGAFPIRFDGGFGLLMPMLKHEQAFQRTRRETSK